MNDRATDILQYWFGDIAANQGAVSPEKQRAWFEKNPQVDAHIKANYEVDVQAAVSGGYDAWLEDAQRRLAAIILIDQFCRQIYRDSPQAFAHDHLALRWAQDAVECGYDQAVFPIQRAFYYLPLEHAEDSVIQAQCVGLFEALEKDAPAGEEARYKSFVEYAIAHQQIIDRFGRFPHRNAVLGRDSTPEEVAFLKEPGSSF